MASTEDAMRVNWFRDENGRFLDSSPCTNDGNAHVKVVSTRVQAALGRIQHISTSFIVSAIMAADRRWVTIVQEIAIAAAAVCSRINISSRGSHD